MYSKVRKERSKSVELLDQIDRQKPFKMMSKERSKSCEMLDHFDAKVQSGQRRKIFREFSLSQPLMYTNPLLYPMRNENVLPFSSNLNRKGRNMTTTGTSFLGIPRDFSFPYNANHSTSLNLLPNNDGRSGNFQFFGQHIKNSMSLDYGYFPHGNEKKSMMKPAYPSFSITRKNSRAKRPTFKSVVNITRKESLIKKKKGRKKSMRKAKPESIRRQVSTRDCRSMPTLLEENSYKKSLASSKSFGPVISDRLGYMRRMYLPEIKQAGRSSYQWVSSSGDEENECQEESSYCSSCSACSSEKREGEKKSKGLEGGNQPNKLVIPIKTSDQPIRIYVPGKPTMKESVDNTLNSKSSIDQMIDEFHKSLPTAKDTNLASDEDSTIYSSSVVQKERQNKNGTVNSRISVWTVNSSVASFDYHKTSVNNSANSGSENKNQMESSKTNDSNGEYEPIAKFGNETRTVASNKRQEYVSKKTSPILTKTSFKKKRKDINEVDIKVPKIIENKAKVDADSLKRKDLHYVTRSKSAKKEQRARAVQRSKTIYLNLSKAKNDGALAKLIEDSTENRFQINIFLKGLWKRKKSMKLYNA